MRLAVLKLSSVLTLLAVVCNLCLPAFAQEKTEVKKVIIEETVENGKVKEQKVEEEIIEENNGITDKVTIEEDINTAEPVNQTESLLSLKGGQKLMEEAEKAIAEGDYDLASTKLQQARRIFNQLSNFYLQLADSFSGIDNRISEEQRTGALKTASYRDEATYQLSLVHRSQNQPELAVPLLIQIIRSQNPTSELGRKSYQQLYELGFVEEPFQTSNN